MHPSAYRFAASALESAEVRGKTVIEAGSFNVNGSVRDVIEAMGPAAYTGTDMRPGPGVDVVCDAADLPARFGVSAADVVLSTEMLEHAASWRAAVAGMVGVLASGGVLVLTTRSPGFPLHGYPDDHWRYSVEAMGAILAGAGLDVLQCKPDPDPAAPGVFAKARKPAGWSWPDDADAQWAKADVTAMTAA